MNVELTMLILNVSQDLSKNLNNYVQVFALAYNYFYGDAGV